VGDRVLCFVASTLKTGLRSTDLGGRYGGEEFMVVVPEATEEGARVLAERLRGAVDTVPRDGLPRVSVSIGVATNELGVLPVEELIARADLALYKAKASGRNRVVTG